MVNVFLTATRLATRKLTASRTRDELWRARAEGKLEFAKEKHAVELTKAWAIEAEAWRELFAIPGMTAPTSSVMTGIEQAEVTRWARSLRTSTEAPNLSGRLEESQ